jgi:hypothetical protein
VHPAIALDAFQFSVVPEAVVEVAIKLKGTLGTAEHPPPPPPPLLLTPLHDTKTTTNVRLKKEFAPNIRILRFRGPRPINKPNEIPGSSNHSAVVEWWPAGKPLSAAFPADVEMFKITFAAEFPGVIGVEGLNKHCASAGSPEHESVTAELNKVPTG